MKRLFVILAMVTVVTAAAFLPLSSARAEGLIHGSGTYVTTSFQVQDIHQEGENTFVTIALVQEWSGDIVGTVTGTQIDVVHRDGSMTLRGTNTCDCTFGGVHFVSESRYEGTGVYNEWLSGTFQIVGGTGVGHGTFNNVYGAPATYEVWGKVP